MIRVRCSVYTYIHRCIYVLFEPIRERVLVTKIMNSFTYIYFSQPLIPPPYASFSLRNYIVLEGRHFIKSLPDPTFAHVFAV